MILLLDNKDSFVFNLAQALRQLGAQVVVERSDRLDERELERRADCRALVISPGPGRPEHAGCSVAAIRRFSGRLPILGVCLGHQAIGHAFGAAVRRGEPVHGRATPIHHDGGGLFRGLPQPFAACRYHSLYVELPPPDRPQHPELLATAFADDGEVMALRHRVHPTFGVQFHPESFCSEYGLELLQNFLAEAA